MATWKEKGVVPDSDEEDDFDIESHTSHQNQYDEPRGSEEHFVGESISGKLNGDDDSRLVQHTAAETPQDTFPVVHEDVFQRTVSALRRQPEESFLPQLDNRSCRLSSPQASPTVFKLATLFDDISGDEDCIEDGRNAPGSQNSEEDEISKSYVRITSPVSSQVSSLSGSQPKLPPHNIFRGEQRANPSPSPSETPPPDLARYVRSPSVSVLPNPRVRSLRERRPIQVHPYIVEQERYRRTLKARGIAPMRIASSQTDRPHRSSKSASPDQESQTQDTQDPDFENEESQQRDSYSDIPASVSPQRDLSVNESFNARDSRSHDQGAGGEDEFPNIEDLLREHKDSLVKPGVKKRIKSYSSKAKRRRTAEKSTEIATLPLTTIEYDVFDVPASPPLTSSPVAATFRRPGVPVSRSGSISKDLTPNWMGDDAFDAHRPGDLPTPATSAIKPVTDLTLLESDPESDDPFTSTADQSQAQSSSDESVQIRKIKRKIRGVLPASHLRLNQQNKLPTINYAQRDSVSPIKEHRRGVAQPLTQRRVQNPPASAFTGIPFLSDESDEEDDDAGLNGIIREDDEPLGPASILDQSRLGDAEEDDRIDAMLPSRKRHSSGSNLQRRKKMRVSSGSLVRSASGSYSRQPRITKHLNRPQDQTSRARPLGKSKSSGNQSSMSRGRKNMAPKRPAPPRLSILDVTDNNVQEGTPVPRFIKIAARTARSKRGSGKQSPTRKYIRLATREDTQDVQSVLNEWTEGRIYPRVPEPRYDWPGEGIRRPLQQIDDNTQTKFRSPVSKQKVGGTIDFKAAQPRKLVVSRRQRSMRDFLGEDTAALHEPVVSQRSDLGLKNVHSQRIPRVTHHSARPAQLEASEKEYSRLHPASAFKSTKKALDALYRNTRKRTIPRANLQLSRFLADDDIVQPSIETAPVINEVSTPDAGHHPDRDVPRKTLRRKKHSPRRIDAGAALYRQPSNPLILEFFAPEGTPSIAGDSKLLGLGKFGTNYPTHFDIFPLQSGVYFHRSTLLGSGRVSEIIKNVTLPHHTGLARPHISLSFADKSFCWGTWNENVSSEIGVCLDWLLDQLIVSQAAESTEHSSDATSVVVFLLDYVQHHLTFNGSLDQLNFLSRMLELFKDFLSRLNPRVENPSTAKARVGIEVLSICAVLVLHVLHVSRACGHQISSSLEGVLKDVSSHCAAFLLSQDLSCVRELYDSLQYLSVRENGIKSDQYIAQAWVILIKVLNSANIPRSSFWDVVNSQLIGSAADKASDAPAMEKLWYSMYTLLPLCEFDEFGVVIPGSRQESSFDNWLLPQQLLAQVLHYYKSNPRQAPGFNDYCRSLFRRCHYLMVEWGWWKCGPVIGTLFDFFASHKLAHLRNEEFYTSPRFLEHLDTEPDLSVAAEDRCFHVFLKIIALHIQQLQQLANTKAIRNIVARLLPNHDRQYPKEEVIHQRDLASLRNHHDLLCTLYWVAPPEQRPSISLIQDLVITNRSHKEACLISLRAWEQLTRFVVSSTQDPKLYKPFTLWQNAFFGNLFEEFLGTEKEVRQQAENFQATSGQAMLEAQITTTIMANRVNTMVPMCRSIKAMANAIRAATSATMATEALNCDILAKAFNPELHIHKQISERLLGDCIDVLTNYMTQIENFHKTEQPSAVLPPDDDSQGSLYDSVDWDRLEMAMPLQKIIIRIFSPLLRGYLETQKDETQVKFLMTRLVSCWARLVNIATEHGAMHLDVFLNRGPMAIFENRRAYRVANSLWPLFLAKLMEAGKTLTDLKIAGFTIESEWFLALTTPEDYSASAKALTSQLRRNGHYLCESVDVDRLLPTQIIRAAIRKMSTLIIDKPAEVVTGLPPKAARGLFKRILGDLMKSVQQHLESLEPDSVVHKYYLGFVRVVVNDIKSYASDFSPLIEFFLHPSKHYWPPDEDPTLLRATIISYSIRLAKQPDKTSLELFHFLHNVWSNSVVTESVENYMRCIRRGLKHWEFTKFMLSEFVPATLEAGFDSNAWVICSSHLPPTSDGIIRLLKRRDIQSEWVFEHTVNILKMIINGAIQHGRRFGTLLNGINPEHRGVLAGAFKFWLAIAPEMRQYVEDHPENLPLLEEVTDPLTDFLNHTMYNFRTSESDAWHPSGELDLRKGKYQDKFVKAIVEHVNNYWQFEDEEGFKVIVKGRSKTSSPIQSYDRPLGDVLKELAWWYGVDFPGALGAGILAGDSSILTGFFL